MVTDLKALGHAIKRAQYRNHRAAERALRDTGVTLVQWDALRAIACMPNTSGHDLAVATFQSDQAFGTLAKRLAARGLIERTAGHGRRIEHALTDKGQAALSEGNRITSEVLKELFSPLTERDLRSLDRILKNLLSAEPPAPHAVEADCEPSEVASLA